MFDYLILNTVFMIILGIIVYLTKPTKLNIRNLFILIAVLLIMTAVFDSLIIALGLVSYDLSKILGVYIGKAPIEDFAYALVAALIVPIIWQKGSSHDN